MIGCRNYGVGTNDSSIVKDSIATAFANGRYGFVRGGGNFIGNIARLSGVSDVAGGADNSEHNVPLP